MKCKYCAYNYGTYCSTGVYPDNEYFKKWNHTLGCPGGKVRDKEIKTKNDIISDIKKAIESYEEKNLLTDVLFWTRIKNEIEEFLL